MWHHLFAAITTVAVYLCHIVGEFFISQQDIAPMHRAVRQSTFLPKIWSNVEQFNRFFNCTLGCSLYR